MSVDALAMTHSRRRTMLETIAWIVFLMCLGAIVVVATFVAIFMLSSDE